MDLVRSWASAIAAYLLCAWEASMLGEIGGEQAAYAGLAGRVVWLYIPLMTTYAVTTGVAAAAHTRPLRWRTRRHLIAVLPVPVSAIVLSTVMSVGGYTAASGVVLSLLSAAAGTVAGWRGTDAFFDLLTRGREAYF